VLGGRQGVRARGVADDDAAAGRRRDVDVVDAGAGAADDLQAVGAGDQVGRDLGRAADDDRVVVGDVVGDLLGAPVQLDVDREVLGEQGDARGGDLLADEDAQVGAGQGARGVGGG
jgi:hypothetical protein